jgi:hypothetical protein
MTFLQLISAKMSHEKCHKHDCKSVMCQYRLQKCNMKLLQIVLQKCRLQIKAAKLSYDIFARKLQMCDIYATKIAKFRHVTFLHKK